ncbi:hypothetical protein [Succinivibrio sp.]|uniref:hypothetical protein n=1 Tax=Succinivibrio sp. TaxID=2053619 RepID=UPI00386E74B8
MKLRNCVIFSLLLGLSSVSSAGESFGFFYQQNNNYGSSVGMNYGYGVGAHHHHHEPPPPPHHHDYGYHRGLIRENSIITING